MVVAREHAYERSFFQVDLGGGSRPTRASLVELPVATTDVITSRAGDDRVLGQQKRPGLVTYSNLVLHRALTGTTDWYEWWQQMRAGEPDVARSVTVALLDERREVVWTWRLAEAFPAAYRFTPLDANSSEPVHEILELAFERLEIV